jgi:hypothetical protein
MDFAVTEVNAFHGLWRSSMTISRDPADHHQGSVDELYEPDSRINLSGCIVRVHDSEPNPYWLTCISSVYEKQLRTLALRRMWYRAEHERIVSYSLLSMSHFPLCGWHGQLVSESL